MKKISLLIVLLCWIIPVFSQTIQKREEKDGYLTLMTGYMKTRALSLDYVGVSLATVTNQSADNNEEKIIMLVFFYETDKTFTQEGSKAIIKTFTGDIVTLKQKTQDSHVIYNRKRIDEVLDRYLIYVNYFITEKELNKIINEGIQVIRIEALTGLKDYVFKDDALGRFIKSEYALIMQKQDFGMDF